MKNFATKICAALLLGWYFMSIIGFDVHTCSASGESFVATFIEGMTCEDIHPEHNCEEHGHKDTCGCCHSEDHGCVSVASGSCCSDDYQVLYITGTVPSDDHRHYDECSCGLCPCVDLSDSGINVLPLYETLISYIHKPGSGLGAVSDRQAVLSVWRI